MHEPQILLKELGLSDSEITVYLAMISGLESARDLMKATKLKRPTLYYALSCLEKRGLVNKNGTESGTTFRVEPLEKLTNIAQQKADDSLSLKNKIEAIIPSLSQTLQASPEKPSIAFYEGIDAVKTTVMSALYCKSKKLESIVPKNNFFWQVGEEFVERFVTQRIKRGIETKNLWEVTVSKKVIDEFYKEKSEIRVLPEYMKEKFETTIFIYDDKTLYVSSKKNAYCVLITSKEHTDMMRTLFLGIWNTSKPHSR